MMLALQVSGSGKRMLVSDSTYYIDVLNSAAAAAINAGYTPVIVPSRLGEGDVETLSVDGALVIDPRGDEPLLRTVRARGGRAVTAGRVLQDGDDCGSVDNDHFRLTRDALDHLVASGYTRPALLTGTYAQSFAADAAAEYRRWAAERELAPIVVSVRAAPSAAAAFNAATALLSRRPARCGLRQLRRLRARCPAGRGDARPAGAGGRRDRGDRRRRRAPRRVPTDHRLRPPPGADRGEGDRAADRDARAGQRRPCRGGAREAAGTRVDAALSAPAARPRGG